MELPEAIKIVLGEAAAQCGSYDTECPRCKAVAVVAKEYDYDVWDFFAGEKYD